MTCQRAATTSARTEAASNAMGYALQATDAETERRTAQAAMHAMATAAIHEPADMGRFRNLEDLRDASIKQRDIAITMATMWANVAAVQEQQ